MMVGVGCKTDDTIYPIGPGGPGGPIGGGSNVDANTHDATDAATILHGAACLLTDLRALRPCATTGAGGFSVHLGSQTATTVDTGTFDIAAPLATNVVWQVSGGAIRTSLMNYNAIAVIPVIASTTFSDLELANGVLEVTGQGSIVAHVVHAGAPVAAATATTSPNAAYAPLYDGTTATAWNQNMTGANGAVWIPGLPVGAATLTITANATPQLVTGIPISDGTITFVTVELP